MAHRTDETVAIRLAESKVPLTFAERELLVKYGFAALEGEEEFQIMGLLNEILLQRRRKNFRALGNLVIQARDEIQERLVAAPCTLGWETGVRLLRKIPIRRCLQLYGLDKGAGSDPLIVDRSVVIGCYSLPALLHRHLAELFKTGCPRNKPICASLSVNQRTDIKTLVTRGFETLVLRPDPPVFVSAPADYEICLRDRKQFPIAEDRAPSDAFLSLLMTVVLARKAYENGELAEGTEVFRTIRETVESARLELAEWVRGLAANG